MERQTRKTNRIERQGKSKRERWREIKESARETQRAKERKIKKQTH